jgi:hypothetical protein
LQSFLKPDVRKWTKRRESSDRVSELTMGTDADVEADKMER